MATVVGAGPSATASLSWDLIGDLRQLFRYPFMVNALLAGTIVAIAAGALGWFMVLRRQSFAGHTLAIVSFPGAAAAILLGISATAGYFAAAIGAAVVLAAIPRSLGGRARSSESAVIGTVQAFALACGFLFVNLYQGFLSGLTGLLFGSITGVSDGQVLALLAAGAGCLLVLAVLGRPLLFSSIDSEVARARGVPVRLVGTAFLVLLGVTAAGASQITGSLLVFALLVTPAAAASQLTARPGLGLALSVLIAVAVTWLGEGIAFFSPYPIGFWVTTLAFAAFCLATGYRYGAERMGRRRPRAGHVRRELVGSER
jgi:zinc/manganese transport system permease protein